LHDAAFVGAAEPLHEPPELLPPLLLDELELDDEELDDVPEEPELDAEDVLPELASAPVAPASDPCDAGLLEGSAVCGDAGSVGWVVVVSAPAPVPVSAEPTAQAATAKPNTSAMPEVALCARTRGDNACCIVASSVPRLRAIRHQRREC
jgi:hypothetical protein